MAGMDFSKNKEQGKIWDWWESDDDHRIIQVLGGERGGKSIFGSFLLVTGMNPTKRELYWIVGPDYRQARPEFLYIYHWLNDAGLIAEVSMPDSETSPWNMTTKWGTKIETRSGGDEKKLASFSVHGIIMSEAAQQSQVNYLKLLGRISETRGFLILIGTLEEGLPWYGQLYDRWQGENSLNARSFSLPTWSNLEIYPGGRDDPEIKRLEAEYPSDLFRVRFGAEPEAKHGLVLNQFSMKEQVKHLEVDERLPVELCIDPAHHTYAVLFVQYDGLVCNVLDRIYAKRTIAQYVIPEAQGNRLWKYIDPSSAGVIDIAGTQHQANKSQVELWKEIAGVTLVSKKFGLDDTINTLNYRFSSNNSLHRPLVYFNDHFGADVAPNGIAMDVLGEPLSWKWPADRPNTNKHIKPIDHNNDAMKALAYGLMHRYGVFEKPRARRKAMKRGEW